MSAFISHQDHTYQKNEQQAKMPSEMYDNTAFCVVLLTIYHLELYEEKCKNYITF